MSGDARRVAVIGGGVIGAACAYYLAKAGWTVTVADRGGFGKGCSHGNCGLVSPSHVLPLAAPGAVGGALERHAAPELAVRDQAALRPRAVGLAGALRPPLHDATDDARGGRDPGALELVAIAL